MDANNIRYFVAVAKYGSINQAAKAMFISQPQLSHIIRSLEEEAGMTLLRRTTQGTRLTHEGEIYLHHCEIILKEMDNLNSYIRGSRTEMTRLSVSMTRFSHTSECFNEICRRYQDVPGMTFKLYEDSSLNVIEDVTVGRSSVGVIHFLSQNADITQKNIESRGLEFIPLAAFRPYVCLSSSHELLQENGRKGLHIEQLNDYGFVRYIGQYEDFIYHIETMKGPVDLNDSQKIVYVTDRQGQMRLISATNFYTIGISEFNGQDSMYKVISVPLLDCVEHLKFGIIRKKNEHRLEIEQEFVDLVCRRYASLQEQENQRNQP
ncbi:LysR family transcriptional regulator [[Clostridium] aminophilum]|uniref:LysR family transcriptional regulator n=1 Tax=[Clostridium] aminophilum TaxID=1526 RepID=UPI0026ECD6E9|nr:LysR family transcriptional regulator [[Clostridium] aminophilum]MDD6195845.1 LysR family transcriptional regulator [[Clostridium] aminophilum]